MRRFVLTLFALLVCGCSEDPGSPLEHLGEPVLLNRWGPGVSYDGFRPYRVAIGPDNLVYVVNLYTGVNRYSKSGAFVDTWPPPPQYVSGAGGLAIDDNGLVYLTLLDLRRVVVLRPDGTEVLRFGEPGDGPGQFQRPDDIAVGPDGSLYVVDSERKIVQKFDASGEFLQAWGNDGTLLHPRGITIEADGNLLVVDSGRLLRFSAEGTLLGRFDSAHGSGDVAVSRDGTIFVTNYSSVARISKNGEVQESFGTAPEGYGYLRGGVGVAVDDDDVVWVADWLFHGLFRFARSGTLQSKIEAPDPHFGAFEGARSVAADLEGNVYILDEAYSRVQKINAIGAFLKIWGGPGAAPGLLFSASDIDVDSQGNVYVMDTGNSRVQRFDGNGVFQGVLHVSGPELAISPDDFLVTADDTAIEIFTTDGRFVRRRDETSMGQPFRAIDGLAVSDRGLIYVLDRHYASVFVFDLQFELRESFSVDLNARSQQFRDYLDISVDSHGRVYIAFGLENRVSVYAPGGGRLLDFPRETFSARGIDVDAEDQVLVTDHSGSQVLKYATLRVR